MVPRSFAQNPLAHRQQEFDFNEKDNIPRRESRTVRPRPSSHSVLSQSLSQRTTESPYTPLSHPVKIPARTEERIPGASHHTGISSLQAPPRSVPTPSAEPEGPFKRKESVHNVLASTTIPIRRKPRPRASQRLPPGDYVADFSKLLRDDVPASGEGSLSGSWANPQFEGLFGNLDGLVEGQMIVGSEGADTGILSVRSLSTESMPSLASPDDFSAADMSSVSPATVRSPSDPRLRQIASSEDCSHEHPLLSLEDDVDTQDTFSGTSTPEFMLSPSTKPKRKPITPQKRPNSFKSSLTASLKALKSAAQSMSNIASTPPLIQPDEFLTRSIFDFQPSLTDDRRPPPLNEPPSAAMRRYLNPHTFVSPDSPAQLHFWVDEKPLPKSPRAESKPKLKIKRKYQNQAPPPPAEDRTQFTGPRSNTAQLPSLVPLATCIPSSIRTPHASSPPTWLEPDGTPSNRFRAAQTLVVDQGWGQPRPREPRENRDFLRVFVCEMNMRKSGKLSDDAIGHARLWLPPIDSGDRDQDTNKETKGEAKREKKPAQERWSSWSTDDL